MCKTTALLVRLGIARSGFRSRYVQHCQEMDVEPLSARALSMRLVNERESTEHATRERVRCDARQVSKAAQVPRNPTTQGGAARSTAQVKVQAVA
jgi:hypothetical protein